MLIFPFELKVSESGRKGNTSKQQNMTTVGEDSISGDDFEAVLAIFSCYGYGSNAFKAVEEITTNEKDNRKCSLCVIVCSITATYY